MFRQFLITLLISLASTFTTVAQTDIDPLRGSWQIGIGFGELPLNGSFKPSITFGYHFNDKLYAGVIYQFSDQISRGSSSFNAKSTGLEGLISSHEDVGQRALVHVHYTPFRNGPYLSAGLVYNATDREVMTFDEGVRSIAGESYSGNIQITQTRPGGWGAALGIGYQYNFRNGLSAGFEWTPAWGQIPTPYYSISGTSNLDPEAVSTITTRMNTDFKRNVTNMYKVFHIGLAYRFPQ